MISDRFSNLFEDRGNSDAYSPPTTPSNELLANSSSNNIGKTEAVQDPRTTASSLGAVDMQAPLKGFGSYLNGILPPDIAQGAGAFAFSMLQIKNIRNISVEKFAQVATSIETTNGLTIPSSTVPVDLTLAATGLELIALGSGPFGTYTMSDFMGCMTGLPYIGLDVDGLIKQLETTKLYDIYNQLYLAVTWQQATFAVTTAEQPIETSPGVYDWQYRITGTTMTNPGGGYTRNGASAPGGDYYYPSGSIAPSGGVLLSTNPDTNSNNVPGTYGRMINLVVANTPGTWVTYATGQSSASPVKPDIEYRLPAPPTTVSSYPYTGASNSAYGTAGWPSMNSVVQTLIDDANAEIAVIQAAKPTIAQQMNTNWGYTGTQLSIEQRAIDTGLPVPVPVAPIDVVTDLAQFPTTQIAFVDSIPQFALDTKPHMIAQSLEAISNLCTPGGQSVVGMMREARNQNRLTEVGIPLDNNIIDALTPSQTKQLIANGTLDGTQPAKLAQVNCDTGDEITTEPYGFYNPTNGNYYVTNPTFNGTQLGTKVDTGAAEVPGSFAGSLYGNLVPANLNAFNTSNTLLPSTYNINTAIDEVVRCNCDCWNLA